MRILRYLRERRFGGGEMRVPHFVSGGKFIRNLDDRLFLKIGASSLLRENKNQHPFHACLLDAWVVRSFPEPLDGCRNFTYTGRINFTPLNFAGRFLNFTIGLNFAPMFWNFECQTPIGLVFWVTSAQHKTWLSRTQFPFAESFQESCVKLCQGLIHVFSIIFSKFSEFFPTFLRNFLKVCPLYFLKFFFSKI